MANDRLRRMAIEEMRRLWQDFGLDIVIEALSHVLDADNKELERLSPSEVAFFEMIQRELRCKTRVLSAIAELRSSIDALIDEIEGK